MHRTLSLLLGATLLAATPAAAAAPRAPDEAKLARTLEGLVPGEPVDCVNLRDVRSTQIIDRTAIVYDTGRTLYVNRPRGGRESLSDWDVLVTETHSNRLCSIDVVKLYDPGARMLSGLVFLGEFVPYRKPTS